MTDPSPIVVAIARQLGSGGSYLGHRIAERLRFRYVDRELLDRAADRLREEPAALAGRDERASTFWEKVLGAFVLGMPEAAYQPPPVRYISDGELFDTQQAIIREVAAHENSVIVGHAGFHVLAGHPRLVSVRVFASDDFRADRLMSLYGIATRAEALAAMRRSDAERERYVQALSGRAWNDLRNYHLSLDTSFLGLEVVEELVLRAVEARRTKGEAVATRLG